MIELFKEFDAVSNQEWLEKAALDLKGTSPLEKFQKNLGSSIEQMPYYDQNSTQSHKFPSISHLLNHREYNPWHNVEAIDVSNEKESNQLAINALENGCNGLHFNNKKGNCDLRILLKNVSLPYCYLALEGFQETDLDVFLKSHPDQPDNHLWNISFIASRENPGIISNNIYHSNFSAYRDISLVIANDNYDTVHESIAQNMSLFVDIASNHKNENIQNLYNRIVVINPCKDHYFYEIAKSRALRILFAELSAYYDVKSPKIFIQSETVSTTDELESLLTNSTQTMAAAIGGADAIRVSSHLQNENEFSRRIARNVSNLLDEEAMVGKVKDPVAGSYYVTELTEKIVADCWNRFLDIETLGGYSRRNERIA